MEKVEVGCGYCVHVSICKDVYYSNKDSNEFSVKRASNYVKDFIYRT